MSVQAICFFSNPTVKLLFLSRNPLMTPGVQLLSWLFAGTPCTAPPYPLYPLLAYAFKPQASKYGEYEIFEMIEPVNNNCQPGTPAARVPSAKQIVILFYN